MLRWNDHERTLDLGARDLLDARESRFEVGSRRLAMSSGGRMRAGQRVHREVEAERGSAALGHAGEGGSWTSERVARVLIEVRGWTCTVHGRMDGVEETDGRTVIEEVKSTALGADDLALAVGFPEWEAQLRLYLWMARELSWPEPVGQLRVVSLVDGAQRIWSLAAEEREAVGTRVQGLLDGWVYERERWLAWQGRRRDGGVRPAHGDWRPGQPEIVEASSRAVEEGRHLLLTAPTGVGKTAAVMAGVLKAAAQRRLGVYWATAKGTQQWVAEKTARAMIEAGTPLRAVTLRSRDNACCNRVGQDVVVDCRPQACRFAAGHADNTERDHVVEALQPGLTGAPEIDSAAGRFTVCPYELAVELGSVADLVIGDYNQAFDPSRALRRLFEERDWVVVVDEAHQLPERAMGYGSPTLPVGLCEPVLAFTDPSWDAMKHLAAELRLRIEEASWQEGGHVGADVIVDLTKSDWEHLRERFDELAIDHARLRDRVDPAEFQAWDELAFAVTHFADALGRAGEETVTLWNSAGLRLVCRDPAPVLEPTFSRFVASVSMSATLRPTWFYRERCGMDASRVDELLVPSPFPPENRRVVVVNGLSTAWKDREKHRSSIRAVLEGVLTETSPRFPLGNVAFYFASYEQRDDLCEGLEIGRRRLLAPGRPTQGVPEDEARALVVAELHARRDVLLATVLGGAFSEGVDLPNDALSTVVIVGPALPPPGVDRRLLQDWFEQRWDAGFDLAYVHPGMTKVVQAAGRVVRAAGDRGTVWLVCERFLRHEFTKYLPEEWEVTRRSAKSVF